MRDNPNLLEVVKGYGSLVSDRIAEGYDPYLLSFMFHQICGSHNEIHSIMEESICRLYAACVTRVMRHPNSAHNRRYPLIWIVAPDYPVPKHARKSLREVRLNNGLHMHAIALVPPINRLKKPLAG